MSLPADSAPPGEYYCPACEKHFSVGDRCPTDGSRLVRLSVRIDPLIGRDLDGRYTILEKLGQGGMGAVYRSSQHSVDREVAIKVVSSHLVSDKDVVKRFLREARLASRLTHPNAVGVLDFGQTDDGVFFLVMELVNGRTLDQVIKSDKVFKPERLVRIASQVCDALEGAHALQIVHRDLKPSNIMLMAQGRDLVKVLDFGLAKSVAPDQTSTTMTNAGALLGTPAYMPPELALGQSCDHRADLYSLGCVLYLLGSGRLPFQSESAHELIASHGTDVAPPMKGVPPALGKVIDRLLAKDPDDRYQSATETRDALEAALEGRLLTPIPASADTLPSIGPFPKTTEDLLGAEHVRDMAALESAPSGRRRALTPTALERLINSETMSAVAAPAVHDTALQQARPPRGRRWLVPAAAATAALGIAVVVFTIVSGSSGGKPAEPAATPVERPAGTATTPRPDEHVARPADPVTKPEAHVTKPVDPVARPDDPSKLPKPAVAKPVPKPRLDPPKPHLPKPDAPKPDVPKPDVPKPKPVPTGTGSASPAKMPF